MDLKKYPLESAGRKIIFNIPTCSPDDNILNVKESVFANAQNLETFNYIYVINEGKLVGVFSLKEIFRRKENERVGNFMNKTIVKASPFDDQEKIAILAIKHELKAIPITDKNNYFLGIIPSDIILDILHKEHVEDILFLAGINSKEASLESSEKILAKVRLPWLIVGLFGGILAAQITIIFEEPLKDYFILAAFIPLIVYMADAVGSQTQTLYIRNLALNNFSKKNYFLKEIKTGVLMALVLSVLFFIISTIISSQVLIGTILSISLFLTIMAAITISVLIVKALLKLGKDPALGSGPFATIIADISSLMIYFSVATLLLRLL